MTSVKMKLYNLGRETNVQQNRASAKTLAKVEDEVQPSLDIVPHACFGARAFGVISMNSLPRPTL